MLCLFKACPTHGLLHWFACHGNWRCLHMYVAFAMRILGFKMPVRSLPHMPYCPLPHPSHMSVMCVYVCVCAAYPLYFSSMLPSTMGAIVFPPFLSVQSHTFSFHLLTLLPPFFPPPFLFTTPFHSHIDPPFPSSYLQACKYNVRLNLASHGELNEEVAEA